MKKSYTQLWLLLGVSFVLFTFLSTFDTFKIFGVEFKGSDLYSSIVSKPTVATSDSIISITKIKTDKKIEMDTTAKNILFIGDSMLEGLGPRLASYAKHNGHKLNSVIWYSSTSQTWGKSDTLKYFIKKHHPDYIIISLGANELFVKDIITKRRQYVKRMLSQIGSIPYIWIGPPNWKTDTGINDLITQETNSGTFFVSNGMSFDRAKDGAHPTRKSATLWMDSVATWIETKSINPIRLEKPNPNTSTRANSTTVLQPMN